MWPGARGHLRHEIDLPAALTLVGLHNGGAFNGSMQHEPDEEVSWCDDVARA